MWFRIQCYHQFSAISHTFCEFKSPASGIKHQTARKEIEIDAVLTDHLDIHRIRFLEWSIHSRCHRSSNNIGRSNMCIIDSAIK